MKKHNKEQRGKGSTYYTTARGELECARDDGYTPEGFLCRVWIGSHSMALLAGFKVGT